MQKKEITVINGKQRVTTGDIEKMIEVAGPLMGRAIYKVESTKVDDTETGPDAMRMYGVKSTRVKSVEYLTKEETSNGQPALIVNNDPELTFSVVENPFRKIKANEAISKDFKLQEGWYTDRQGIYAAVKAMNTGTLAAINAKISKLTEMAASVEDAMNAETNGEAQEEMVESILAEA